MLNKTVTGTNNYIKWHDKRTGQKEMSVTCLYLDRIQVNSDLKQQKSKWSRNKTAICGALVVASPPLTWQIQQARRQEMWLRADSTAPIRFLLSHCLARCSTTEQRPQDRIKPEMINYQLDYILLHNPFLEITPDTNTRACSAGSDGFRVETINQISSPHFQIARPSDISIRSLMWNTQDQTKIELLDAKCFNNALLFT